MLATVMSCALFGIDAFPVIVETDVSFGLPGYNVVGLPETSVTEGAVRIRSALEKVGQSLPNQRVTVNLAPADQKKRGSAFDLPIAVGVLLADGVFPQTAIDGLLLLGELGLDGSLRSVPGILAAALLAKEQGMRGILVPRHNVSEASVVEGIEVYGVSHLGEVCSALSGDKSLEQFSCSSSDGFHEESYTVDMSDVHGQAMARLAIEVAVAGGHNILLLGPPGIGKTMLAKRIPTLLPPMLLEESLETTKIYSSIGLAPQGIIRERPFRSPHHTASRAALLGGGNPPKPGEISLAHHGVLFLDELPEFQKQSLESLRQPLEDRTIVVSRMSATVTFPSSFLLVASANPCPCGWNGANSKNCTCTPSAIDRYSNKLSGPLLDRMDLQVDVPVVELEDIRSDKCAESSRDIRARIIKARDRQQRRLRDYKVYCNAEMSTRMIRETCVLTDCAEKALKALYTTREKMTARKIDRLIKVGQTISDLSGVDHIDGGCIYEAAGFQMMNETPTWKVRHIDPPTNQFTNESNNGGDNYGK